MRRIGQAGLASNDSEPPGAGRQALRILARVPALALQLLFGTLPGVNMLESRRYAAATAVTIGALLSVIKKKKTKKRKEEEEEEEEKGCGGFPMSNYLHCGSTQMFVLVFFVFSGSFAEQLLVALIITVIFFPLFSAYQ